MYSLTAEDRPLYENGTLTAEGLRAAMARRDPRLAEYLVKFVLLDPAPEALVDAANEHRPNYLRFIHQVSGPELQQRIQARDPTLPGQSGYSRLGRQKVIGAVHHESWAELESEASAGHLPGRLTTYALIQDLWDESSAYSREMLLEIIATVPLMWGPWRALKRIFKRAIERGDWTIFAALVARFDAEARHPAPARPAANTPLVEVDGELQQVSYNPGGAPLVTTTAYTWSPRRGNARDVRPRTLDYLMRRARRALEGLARAQPELFPFVAAELLVRYPARAPITLSKALMGDVELWARSIEPLMRIVELSQNDEALQFAFGVLETRFREALKLADPAWILRLVTSPRRRARRLAVRWFLEPICGYEVGRFHEVGLQAAALALLDFEDDRGDDRGEQWDARGEDRWLRSWSADAPKNTSWPALARSYAVDYIRGARDVVAADLSLEKVLWLMRSREKAYRGLGEFLLGDDGAPSPYAPQLTLDVWTELLEDPYTHAFALPAIRRGFSGVDLTADWYAGRLLSKHAAVREVALSFLKDETKYRADDDWLAFHKKILRSTEARDEILQRSLYQLARKDEAGRSELDGLPADFLRALLVHPSTPCHLALISWVDGGRVSLDRLGVDFIKLLATREDWEAGGWREALGEERTEEHDERAYIGTVGAAARRWLKDEVEIAALGYGWALARVDKEGADTDFLRALFLRDMPLAQLAPDPEAESAAAAGARAALERVLAERDAGGRVANFYKRFLLARHPGVRGESPELPPLDPALALPEGALAFEHFERMAADERAPVRAFAMEIADWELARWTAATPLSFPRLKPLLRDAFHDIRRYLIRAMSSPRRPEGRLDLSGETFEVEALYAWCFDARKEIRDLGMEIILRHPQRFGQPEQLLQLSESSDRRVREMVIEVIWAQFRSLPVTPEWRPNERSVVPQSASLARSQRVVALPVPPPEGVAPADVSRTRKYLGGGAPPQGAPDREELTGTDALEDFIRSALFQLPPIRQSPKLPPRGYTVKTAWRNKRTLIGAVRDLGVRDRAFAGFILPILTELRAVRGQMVSNASLVALAHLHAAHPDLNALGDLA